MENRIFAEFLNAMRDEATRRPDLEKSVYGSGYVDGLLKATQLLNEVMRKVRSEYDKEVNESTN